MPTPAKTGGGKKLGGIDVKIWIAAVGIGLVIGYFYLRRKSTVQAGNSSAAPTDGQLAADQAAAQSGQPAANTDPAANASADTLAQLALGQGEVIGQLGTGALQLASDATLASLGLAGQVVSQWPPPNQNNTTTIIYQGTPSSTGPNPGTSTPVPTTPYAPSLGYGGTSAGGPAGYYGLPPGTQTITTSQPHYVPGMGPNV